MSKAGAQKSLVSNVADGFFHGLGQLVSVSGTSARKRFPDTQRSAAEALSADWDKLEGDLRRAARGVAASAVR